MIMCRWSAKVGRVPRPTASQKSGPRGSVATMSEYTGTMSRPLPGRVGVQPAQIVLSEAERPVLFESGECPLLLGLASNGVDGAALLEVAVDAFACRASTHDVDGLVHGVAHGAHGVDPVPTRESAVGGCEQRRTPSTVATGGPKAGDLALQDDDAQRRVRQGQRMGRPQAGKAGADYADVDLEILVESATVRQGERDPLPPQGEPCVLGSRSGSRRYIRRHALASTSRSVDAMKSISSCPQMSGGDNWTTGSPRSSARQMSPASKSAPERKPRNSRSDSSSSNERRVSLSLTSSIP